MIFGAVECACYLRKGPPSEGRPVKAIWKLTPTMSELVRASTLPEMLLLLVGVRLAMYATPAGLWLWIVASPFLPVTGVVSDWATTAVARAAMAAAIFMEDSMLDERQRVS